MSIRFKEQKRRTKERQSLRKLLYKKQNGICYWCRTPMYMDGEQNNDSCTLEHLTPEHAGGPTDETNCVAACHECNNQRGGAYSPPLRYKGETA